MKLKKIISNPLIYSMTWFICCLLMKSPIYSQVQCGGEDVTNCLDFPFLTYQCYGGPGNVASNLYGGPLLQPNDALNVPQYLTVKGFITFEADYTFAQGSEIVFLDNNSGFKVTSGATLTLDGCSLHGCTKLWAGVEVKSGSNNSTLVAQNCTFADARVAIVLRDKASFEISGCTFRKNLCSILAKTDATNQSTTISVTPDTYGISGNTFYGDEPLVEAAVPKDIDLNGGANPPLSPTNYPCYGIWLERVTSFSIGRRSENPTSDGSPNTFLHFGQNQE